VTKAKESFSFVFSSRISIIGILGQNCDYFGIDLIDKMHSAQRAKLRRMALEERMKSDLVKVFGFLSFKLLHNFPKKLNCFLLISLKT
jgi:hypothetical protein